MQLKRLIIDIFTGVTCEKHRLVSHAMIIILWQLAKAVLPCCTTDI